MAIVIAAFVIIRKLSTSSNSRIIEFVLTKVRTNIGQKMAVKVDSKDTFISSYKAAHEDPSKMPPIIANLTQKLRKGAEKEACGWVREVEEQLHQDPKERYNCVLANFGGDHPLTASIVDPTEGWWTKMMESCLRCNPYLAGPIAALQKAKKRCPPRIFLLFSLLLLHLFDYIKDIGTYCLVT